MIDSATTKMLTNQGAGSAGPVAPPAKQIVHEITRLVKLFWRALTLMPIDTKRYPKILLCTRLPDRLPHKYSSI